MQTHSEVAKIDAALLRQRMEFEMIKYQEGDIVCTTIEGPDGRFQGKVIVRGSVIHEREAHTHLCSEIDDSKEDAMRRAIQYVQINYPPE